MTAQLFLSQAGSDSAAAQALAQRLRQTPQGQSGALSVWLDFDALEA
ncbi:hypothetical protein TRP8649_03661 [Pelagimonas phthalicica]|uniref:Uncharacterized protein n=1 Tax=Pelagimonas phthalicica TaxID=1037362 RepID=A0A238JGH7_9RHOB|nr:hypothetical protein [Pelagimonas phthalicica]TDS92454.1 hypothetical protein CLV87_3656 [Pelagimonas phthalicica]SMX29525.1 hypothetical protein TRP8649_03661 [Pelagimonas phthalicica]